MEKKRDLITLINDTGRGIEDLNALKKELSEVDTPELVTGFLKVKDYSTKVNSFVDAVKKELVDNKTQEGRVYASDVEIDEKGHRYLYGSDGSILQAQRRVSSKFNSESAMKYLEEKGMVAQATDEQVVCNDPNTVVQVLRDKVLARLYTLDCPEPQADALIQYVNRALDCFSTKLVVNEGKMTALVTLGMIDEEDLDQFVDIKETYALMEKKKK